MAAPKDSVLVADIGGTHARFALAVGLELAAPTTLECARFETLEAALGCYLESIPHSRRPRHAAFAIAAPVDADDIALTNGPWRVSRAAIAAAHRFASVRLVNDFAALAQAVPLLAEDDLSPVGSIPLTRAGVIGVLGPGTGLGVASIVPGGQGWTVLPGEGGHVTLAAETELEWKVLRKLRERYPHVSAERVVSGPGLVEIARCLDTRWTEPGVMPADVIGAVRAGNAQAAQALELFFGWLGMVAGNLALTIGAHGGIALGGGLLPRVRAELAGSSFRARFCRKGRFSDYLARIGTALIVHPHAALLGLAATVATTRETSD